MTANTTLNHSTDNCNDCVLGHYCGTGVTGSHSPRARRFQVGAGEVLYRQGSNVQWLHVLCSGSARLETGGQFAGRLILSVARAGQPLGLEDLWRADHSHTATMLQPGVVARISRTDFAAVAQADPTAMMAAMQAMAEWNHYLATSLPRHLRGGVAQRLAAVFSDLAEREGAGLSRTAALPLPEPAGNSELRLGPRLRRYELAKMICCSPETISRRIKSWKARGIVREERKGQFILSDLPRLRRMARV